MSMAISKAILTEPEGKNTMCLAVARECDPGRLTWQIWQLAGVWHGTCPRGNQLFATQSMAHRNRFTMIYL